MIAKSILSPATLMDRLCTMEAREITATSVVPPPISTIILHMGSETGRPAPIAAAMGSSIRKTLRAPADSAASITARFSTGVIPDGTAITIRDLTNLRLPCTLSIKWRSIASVTSKSAITPSRIGRIATMLPGVFPNMFFASRPTAKTRFFTLSLPPATTEGSLNTIPFPFSKTSVFAVPRSIARSFENTPKTASVTKPIAPHLLSGSKDTIRSMWKERADCVNKAAKYSIFLITANSKN